MGDFWVGGYYDWLLFAGTRRYGKIEGKNLDEKAGERIAAARSVLIQEVSRDQSTVYIIAINEIKSSTGPRRNRRKTACTVVEPMKVAHIQQDCDDRLEDIGANRPRGSWPRI